MKGRALVKDYWNLSAVMAKIEMKTRVRIAVRIILVIRLVQFGAI